MSKTPDNLPNHLKEQTSSARNMSGVKADDGASGYSA